MEWAKPFKKLLYLLPAPIFWLGVWQLCAFLVDRHLSGKGNELLLPYPTTVFSTLVEQAGQALFWQSILATLLRVVLGLGLGIALGAILAFLTCLSRWCDRLLSPAIRVIRAAPVASFILLVILWTGRSNVPAVIAAMMVLPVVWDNLSQGIRATDPKLLELGRAYRLSRKKVLTLIYLPSLRPHILSALTTGAGLAWKSGVAAEVLCLPRPALGTQIYNTKYLLEIPELFAWTAVTVALSLILEQLLRRGVSRWGKGWST